MLHLGTVFSVLLVCYVGAVEFTFELQDNSKECFHEMIDRGIKSELEFQVITGGNYDVDVEIKSPNGRRIYYETRRQYDSHQFTTEERGEYTVCFNNEFSTFAHKTIYFDWQVGDEPPIVPVDEGAAGAHTALTMIESAVQEIHESLNTVIDYQTHFKLRESSGRSFGEELNERVGWWSAGQTLVILLVGIGQVIVLRSFFTERRPPSAGTYG